MQIPSEMKKLAGTAIGLMIFMVVTALGYIFGGVLKSVSGMTAAGNTTVDAVLVIFGTITGLLTIVVLWQVFSIILKGVGGKN